MYELMFNMLVDLPPPNVDQYKIKSAVNEVFIDWLQEFIRNRMFIKIQSTQYIALALCDERWRVR